MAKTRAQLPHLYYPPNMYQTRINNAQNFGGGGGGEWDTLAVTNLSLGAFNTTGANLLVAVSTAFDSTPAISDNQGNTWTQAVINSASTKVAIYYVVNPTTNASHLISVTGTAPNFCAIALSGSAASPLDQTGSSNTASLSNVTPTVDNSLIVTGVYNAIADAVSISSPFVIDTQLGNSSGVRAGSAIASTVQETAAAITPSWSGGIIQGAVIATFKPS